MPKFETLSALRGLRLLKLIPVMKLCNPTWHDMDVTVRQLLHKNNNLRFTKIA